MMLTVGHRFRFQSRFWTGSNQSSTHRLVLQTAEGRVHSWRPRKDRFGELVQWDTSDHEWLEGRGERLYLIAMIDDATSRLFGRFVRDDRAEEEMELLGG